MTKDKVGATRAGDPAPMDTDLGSTVALVVREIAGLGNHLTSVERRDADGVVRVTCRDARGSAIFAVLFSAANGPVRAGIVRKGDPIAYVLRDAWPSKADGPVPGRCFTLDTQDASRLFLRALWRELAFHVKARLSPEITMALAIEEIVARDPAGGGVLVAGLIARYAEGGVEHLARILFDVANPDPIPVPPRAVA